MYLQEVKKIKVKSRETQDRRKEEKEQTVLVEPGSEDPLKGIT